MTAFDGGGPHIRWSMTNGVSKSGTLWRYFSELSLFPFVLLSLWIPGSLVPKFCCHRAAPFSSLFSYSTLFDYISLSLFFSLSLCFSLFNETHQLRYSLLSLHLPCPTSLLSARRFSSWMVYCSLSLLPIQRVSIDLLLLTGGERSRNLLDVRI